MPIKNTLHKPKKMYSFKPYIMNVSLFAIQFLIQYANDEILKKIKEEKDWEPSSGKISLSIENNYDGIGLYLLNYDEINFGDDKMRIIRDCVDEVFNDLVQVCENPIDEDVDEPISSSPI